MDPLAPRPRDLADRPRLQPAGRRPARRLRPAPVLLALLLALTFALGACARQEAPKREDFAARFVADNWDGLDAWRIDDLVAGLRKYIEGDYPVFPIEAPQTFSLHQFLFREKPEPAALVPLFPLPPERDDVDERRLRSDLIASCVVTSFIRRVAEEPDTPDRAALYDAIVAVGVPFAFDPAWGDSHTNTSVEVTEFLAEAKFPACPESRAAVARHFPALLREWRGRVTRKGSSVFFGLTLRHMGAAGAAALCAEWDGMDENEREDLVRRLAYEDEAGRAVRERLVGALLDPAPDVRGAAFQALRAHGAPLGDLDPSARETDLEKGLPALRRWVAETES